MRTVVGYTVIVLGVWIIGMVLDVTGLYFGVRYASKDKVKLSKIGYYTMRLGEIIEQLSIKSMMPIPLLLLLAILKVI